MISKIDEIEIKVWCIKFEELSRRKEYKPEIFNSRFN
jgi:hypothetical protein